jgi:hypothetical protein
LEFLCLLCVFLNIVHFVLMIICVTNTRKPRDNNCHQRKIELVQNLISYKLHDSNTYFDVWKLSRIDRSRAAAGGNLKM